jgi:hypothetical protein
MFGSGKVGTVTDLPSHMACWYVDPWQTCASPELEVALAAGAFEMTDQETNAAIAEQTAITAKPRLPLERRNLVCTESELVDISFTSPETGYFAGVGGALWDLFRTGEACKQNSVLSTPP